MSEQRRTFERDVEGSRGTVVFGNGVPAVTVDVESVGDGYLGCVDQRTGDMLLIPAASIAYYRFANED